MNEGFEKLRKLTKSKNKEECAKLLKASLDKDEFITFINSYINDDNFYSNIDFSDYQRPFVEGEYRELNKRHYSLLWDVLEKQNFTMYDALNPEIWLSISMQLIQNNIIQPSFLAFEVNNKGIEEGYDQILRALLSLKDESIIGPKNTPMWLYVSRAILRRMFGAITERGKKGIFQDVPFAIAWRKMYIAKEVSKGTNLQEHEILDYLVKNPTNYNDLVIKMGGKLTVIADKNIRDGLFKYLLDTKVQIDTTYFENLTKRIGIESTWRGMGILSPEENKEIIGKLKI